MDRSRHAYSDPKDGSLMCSKCDIVRKSDLPYNIVVDQLTLTQSRPGRVCELCNIPTHTRLAHDLDLYFQGKDITIGYRYDGRRSDTSRHSRPW